MTLRHPYGGSGADMLIRSAKWVYSVKDFRISISYERKYVLFLWANLTGFLSLLTASSQKMLLSWCKSTPDLTPHNHRKPNTSYKRQIQIAKD